MLPIGEVTDRELAWGQTGYCRGEYELRADGEVIAALRWREDSLALAESADGRWSISRPSLRRSPVRVRSLESGTGVATFGSGWTGGTLQTAYGRRYVWSAANFWRSRWRWRDEDRTPLACFETRQRLVRVQGRVRIEEAALALTELDLLVVLGWYLTVMRAKDATTDAVAATAGTAGS